MRAVGAAVRKQRRELEGRQKDGRTDGKTHLEDVLLDPDHAQEGGDDDARPREVQAVRVVERLRAGAHDPLAQLRAPEHNTTRTLLHLFRSRYCQRNTNR